MDNPEIICNILKECESNGTAPQYVVSEDTYKVQKSPPFSQSLPVRTEPVKIQTDGEEIFVVSDLHIASGRNYAGVYKGTENFFADDSFNRFLEYAHKVKDETYNAILIVNGDIFDFLRITEYPGKVRKVRTSRRIKQILKMNPVREPEKPSPETVQEYYK
jgi:hypothetical protein